MNTPTTQQNNTQNPSPKIDYKVMTNAIANAALSRRAALHIELAVSMIHFTQEKGGTDSTGKANLKAVYHGAGYMCMEKADRDYKTVNRRLNAMAKAFDKIGSSLVHSWIEKGGKSTLNIINTVQAELAVFGFDTLDDVLEYVGVDTNRTRAPRQTSGPVVDVTPAAEAGAEVAAGPALAPAAFNADNAYANIVANMDADAIREFCTKLLMHVATVETAAEQAALPVVAAVEETVLEVAPAPAPAPARAITPDSLSASRKDRKLNRAAKRDIQQARAA